MPRLRSPIADKAGAAGPNAGDPPNRQNGRTVAVRGFPAGPGYDLVTGVGTISAARFVPELAAAAAGSGGR